MKDEIIVKHMSVACYYAKLSTCNRRKVGCIVVKDDRVISMGYNGTPKGWDNDCEDENGNTHPYVFHAETNAISKLAKSTESSKGSSLFVTDEPCYDCAKLISQCDIDKVFFYKGKKEMSGVDLLIKCNIEVYRFLKDPLKVAEIEVEKGEVVSKSSGDYYKNFYQRVLKKQ